jgi:hypothetical protein
MKKVIEKHGGKRQGAGRPFKFPFEFKMRAGQLCEEMWHEATLAQIKTAKKKLLVQDTDLQALFRKANSVPVKDRSEWLLSENYEVHSSDVSVELATINGCETEFEPTSRVVTIGTKPPRGTRKAILDEIATQYKLSKTQAKNIWLQYRSFEKSLTLSDTDLD